MSTRSSISFPERETRALLDAREPRLLEALDAILVRRPWTREALLAFQFGEMKRLVGHAYHTVPFYRTTYDAAGFHPDHLRRPDDLACIPLLTKEELRNADNALLKSTRLTDAALLLASSGSTGIPSRIWRDVSSLWKITAYNLVWYHDLCRGTPLENVLYFVDPAPDSIDCALADLLRTLVSEERLISITESTAYLLEKLDEYQPAFISSYPSTLRNVARTLDAQHKRHEGLQLLHLTSEMLDRPTRALLNKVFPNARIVESYTSTEAGLIAYPCCAEGRLHLAEESVFCEILDDAHQPTCELGRLVVTDLTNLATPIIRYQGLGDFCRWADTACGCGSPFRAITQLEGRASESLVASDGALISPYLLLNAIEEIGGIAQYQVIQQAVNDVEILIVPDHAGHYAKPAIEDAALRHARRVLGAACRCRIRFVERIEPSPGAHKVPLAISYPGRRP